MKKDEIQVLLQAADRLKINPSELKALNPWTQKGPRAEAMQMAVLEVNPAMAARWRSESGEEMSLKTVAYEHGLVEGSKEVFDDLRAHSPAFVAQEQQAKETWEQKMLSEMDSKAKELAASRGVDTEAAAQKYNAAVAGKFQSYFEGLNQEAAREQKAQQDSWKPSI